MTAEPKAPLFEMRDGRLVGAGAAIPFSDLVARARRRCKAELVLWGKGEQAVFKRLVDSYPAGKFWQGRSGELVESVCRSVARYVSNLDNWTDEELRADAPEIGSPRDLPLVQP